MSQFSSPCQVLLIAMATERLGTVAVLPCSIQCIFRLIKEFWNFLLPVRELRSVVLCEWAVEPNWGCSKECLLSRDKVPWQFFVHLEVIQFSSYFYLLQLSTWLHWTIGLYRINLWSFIPFLLPSRTARYILNPACIKDYLLLTWSLSLRNCWNLRKMVSFVLFFVQKLQCRQLNTLKHIPRTSEQLFLS